MFINDQTKLTREEARQIARQFMADYVNANRQWSTATIEGYLPAGLRFDDGASFAGVPSVASVSDFIRAESVIA